MGHFFAHDKLTVENYFDQDQELEFYVKEKGTDDEIYFYMTRSQVEDLVDHLTEVLEAR